MCHYLELYLIIIILIPFNEFLYTFPNVSLWSVAYLLLQSSDIRKRLRHIARLHGQVYSFRLLSEFLFDGTDEIFQLNGVGVADVAEPVAGGGG